MAERRPGRITKTLMAAGGGAIALAGAFGINYYFTAESGDCRVPVEQSRNDFTDIAFPEENSPFSSFASGRWDQNAFVDNGVGFRLAMLVLQDREDDRFGSMISLYRRFKQACGGREFTVNGEVFEPRIGDVYDVINGSEYPVIFMLPDDGSRSRANFLFWGMKVEIMTGLVDVPMSNDGEVQKMFTVRVVDDQVKYPSQWNDDLEYKAKVGAIGYVYEKFLGWKVSQGN